MGKIISLKENKEYIPQMANWIFNAFIKGIRKEKTIEDIEKSLDETETYIYMENFVPMGTVSIFKDDLEGREYLTPWLAALYVDEKYRGQRIAEKLINHVKKVVKERGINRLYLRTEVTRNYYLSLGWEDVVETSDRYYDKVYVMKIEL